MKKESSLDNNTVKSMFEGVTVIVRRALSVKGEYYITVADKDVDLVDLESIIKKHFYSYKIFSKKHCRIEI